MSYAIETRSLSKVLGARRVLSDLDLQVAVGETVAFHGDNGAGKTTLLRALANVIRPTTGSVCWFGEPTDARRSGQGVVGLVAHESFLYLELTAQENLLLAARLQGVYQPRSRAQQWLERIWFREGAHYPAGRLSRGMRQRLSIARALIHEPQLVFLDEPFNGLDEEGQKWLIDLFGEWRQEGRTICFTSHDRQLSGRLANRVLWLHAGRWHVGETSNHWET